MKAKKEDDENEIIEESVGESIEEDNPKPAKKAAKKKVKRRPAKKVEEKKEASKAASLEHTEDAKEEKNGPSEEKSGSSEDDAQEHDSHKKEKKKAGKVVTTILVLVVIIAIILLIANIDKLFPKKEGAATTGTSDVAAIVNGETITNEQLNKQYDVLPAQYKLVFTKEAFLDQMIDEAILLQEAKKEGIEVDEQRVDEIVDSIVLQSGLSLDEFESRLSMQGISLDYIKSYYKDQIMISDLLNKTIFSDIEVTLPERVRASHILVNISEDAEEIIGELDDGADFAEIARERSLDISSKPMGGDLGYFTKGQMVKEFEDAVFDLGIGEVSDAVKTEFGYHIIKLTDKQPEEKMRLSDVKIDEQKLVGEDVGDSITAFLEELKSKSAITKGAGMGATAASEIKTFKSTGDSICSEDGKPVIRLFSTTKCPHCRWIKSTFDDTVKEYGDKIAAYHWELDTGDNTLTADTEEAIPKSELGVFSKYNPKSSVPTFVFGCKYYRVGNAYEASGDLEAEKAEFRAVIEGLLSEP